MANLKKKKTEELNEKLNLIIGIVIGVLTIAIVVIAGVMIFERLGNNDAEGQNPIVQNNVDETQSLEGEESVDVLMKTSKGDVTMKLYPKLMPVTVANFVELVNQKFYDGLTFHRVEDWVVQTGDPTGTGTSGSDKNIEFETTQKLSHVRGAIGMARNPNDYNSANSQFYIVKNDTTSIDGEYALFGMVTAGMDIIDSIQVGDTVTSIANVE